MALVIEDARRLINRRVRVVLEDGLETVAPLRGVSSTGTAILLDVKNLREVRLKGVKSIEWAPFRCSSCGDEVDTIHGDDQICAQCYRRRAANERAAGPHVTPCDDCGGTPAFRNPKGSDNTKLRCAQCHAKNGDLPTDYSIIVHSFPAAECVGEDIDSPKHKWRQLKSSRWHCEGYGCNTDRYTPPRW